MKTILSLFILLAVLHRASAQENSNIIAYDSIAGSPKASIDVIDWLAGYWKGEAFGGITEEVWTPALGKSMMCTFKLVVNEEVKFYEIETLVEEKETLILRLKHFNRDLTGWEEKEKTVDFRLVKVTPNRIYFDEFTFEKISDSEINMYVMIGSKGKKEEIKFNYHKSDL